MKKKKLMICQRALQKKLETHNSAPRGQKNYKIFPAKYGYKIFFNQSLSKKVKKLGAIDVLGQISDFKAVSFLPHLDQISFAFDSISTNLHNGDSCVFDSMNFLMSQRFFIYHKGDIYNSMDLCFVTGNRVNKIIDVIDNKKFKFSEVVNSGYQFCGYDIYIIYSHKS